MRNILNEKPKRDLHGRILECTRFVINQDIRSKTVLDIGCGYGWMELNLLDRRVEKVCATEVSKEDLTTIKANVTNTKVKICVADALNLPFKDSLFDTVVCWDVLEHIPKNTEDRMFSEVRRVLKKDGVFYLSTPFDSFFSKISDTAWWLIGHRHYSLNQIRTFAKSNSFKTTRIYVKGRFWNLISGVDMYFSKWILQRKPLFEEFIAKKEDEEFKKDGYMSLFVRLKKINAKKLS